MIDIIVNTSNLQKGGALQVALSFVNEANKLKGFQFHVFLGRESAKVINAKEFGNIKFFKIDFHPTDSIKSYFSFRKKLSQLESQINPKAVITVFGPCYWKPKSRHIMGFANGYLLYDDTYFFQRYPGQKGIKYKLKKALHKRFLKQEADFYWTETDDSSKRLANFLDKEISKIVVASNNASNYFRENKFYSSDKLPKKSAFRLVYISSFYLHKGFDILKDVMCELNSKGRKVELLVTLQKDDFEKCFEGCEGVINLGRVNPRFCPSIYKSSDAVIIPSLLETFSASYPEAMISEKPIITTDLPFSRDICQDAALYFDPSNSRSAVDRIIELMDSHELYNKKVQLGKTRVLDFDLPEKRFSKILNKIIN